MGNRLTSEDQNEHRSEMNLHKRLHTNVRLSRVLLAVCFERTVGRERNDLLCLFGTDIKAN